MERILRLVNGQSAATENTPQQIWQETRLWCVRNDLWVNHCVERTYHQLLQLCPHIIGPILGDLSTQSTSNWGFVDQLDSIQLGKALETQYGSILAKLRQIMSLEEERISKILELQALLKECGAVGSLSSLLDGSQLMDLDSPPSHSTTRAKPSSTKHLTQPDAAELLQLEHQNAQDLLMSLEADLKYEEVFWKWMLPATRSMDAESSDIDAKCLTYLNIIESILFPHLVQGRMSSEGADAVLRSVEASFCEQFNISLPNDSTVINEHVGVSILHMMLQHCAQISPHGVDIFSSREMFRRHFSSVIDDIIKSSPFDIAPAGMSLYREQAK